MRAMFSGRVWMRHLALIGDPTDIHDAITVLSAASGVDVY